MKLTLVPGCMIIAVALTAPGCTSQQVLYPGQAWQRNACDRIADNGERERCMSRTNSPYEDYKRQTEGGRKP